MRCKAMWEYRALQHQCPLDGGVSGATTFDITLTGCEMWGVTESLLRPTPSLKLLGRVQQRLFSSKGRVHKVKGNKHESFEGGGCLHQLSQVSTGISLLICTVRLDLAGPHWQCSSFQLYPPSSALLLLWTECSCCIFLPDLFSEFPSNSCAGIHFLPAGNRPHVESNDSAWYVLCLRF